MATVLFAKPCVRAEGKKLMWGYFDVTETTVIHVSPKHIFAKIVLVGVGPWLLLFGPMIARKHALEWAANPPENSQVLPVGDIAAAKRGRLRLNKNALCIVSTDGQEHMFGLPYKSVQPALAQALAGHPATVEPI